jgi:hypothetical protein
MDTGRADSGVVRRYADGVARAEEAREACAEWGAGDGAWIVNAGRAVIVGDDAEAARGWGSVEGDCDGRE